MVSLRLYCDARGFIEVEIVCSHRTIRVAGSLFTPATLLRQGRATVAMARALEEIARRDRRWFRAHPERWHRCRWPDPGELDFCDRNLGARLIIAIRHLGRGRIVYQPVIFEGALPADERSAAALFALAVRDPEPIPVVTEIGLLLRLGGALSQRITATATSSLSAVALPPSH